MSSELSRNDRLCDQFEQDWKEGHRPRIEDFLSKSPEPDRPGLLRELLRVELERRQTAGETPELEEYRKRFPDQAAIVRSCFALLSIVRPKPDKGPGELEPRDKQNGPAMDAPKIAGAIGDVVDKDSADIDAMLDYSVGRNDGEIGPWIDVKQQEQLRREFAFGQVLQNRYRIDDVLGQGGMGVVFLGRDLQLDRLVAIKVSLLAAQTSNRDETHLSKLRADFAEEARLGAKLNHPSIATVFDYGVHGDKPFTVFEYLPGETLSELLQRRGRLPLEEVRLIIGPLAQALDFAHERRVVHLDLKPANIQATEQGQFKVLDLGVAREFGRDRDWSGFAGTSAYASPERASEVPCDGRADQYALALIVFELLTGHRLFRASSDKKMLAMHRDAKPDLHAELSNVPDEVIASLERALSKNPNSRFSTCMDFAVALGCKLLSSPAATKKILMEADIERLKVKGSMDWRSFSWRTNAVHLALTRESIWAIYNSEVRRWPLSAVERIEPNSYAGDEEKNAEAQRTMRLTLRDPGDQLQLIAFQFVTVGECKKWASRLEALTERSVDQGAPEGEAQSSEPSPVVLLRQRPTARHELLGRIEARGNERRTTEARLQVRAAVMGADAVVDLQEEFLPEFHCTVRRLTGWAVRAVDDEGRFEFQSRWCADRVAWVSSWALILLPVSLLVSVSVQVLGNIRNISALNLAAPPVFVPMLEWEIPRSVALIAVCHIWPFVLAVLTRLLRWPQFVRPLALALAAFVLGLIAFMFVWIADAIGWMAHAPKPIRDVVISLVAIGGKYFIKGLVVAMVLFGLLLARTAWRAGEAFRRIAQIEKHKIPVHRKLGGALALFVTISYGVLMVWFFVGNGYWVVASESGNRTQANRKDTRALHFSEEGFAALDSNPAYAEEMLRVAIKILEELVRDNPSSLQDRIELVRTRTGLGVLALKQGRRAEGLELLTKCKDQWETLASAQLSASRRADVNKYREWLRSVIPDAQRGQDAQR